MALIKRWSALYLLSLSIPALSFASPFWFFSSSPDSTCPKGAECRKAAPCEVKEDRCEKQKCEAKPCCTTKTVTEVIKICEDPCHPTHCAWDAALSLGIGYRHDRIRQKISNHTATGTPSWRSTYQDVSSVEGVLRFDARIHNFVLYVEGDYAPEVGGNLTQSFKNPVDPTLNTHFKFRKLNGYEADAMASIGYRLRFINSRDGQAFLVPGVGYRYSHQAYETYSQDDFVNRTLAAGNVRHSLQDQAPMHADWFGPYVEARLSFVFWNQFHIDPYYQYYFLDLRARKKVALTSITIDPTLVGAPPTQQVITKANIHNNSARGQSAGVDLYWQFKNQFRLGGKGSWNTFHTSDAKARVKVNQKTFATNPPVETTTLFKEDAHTHWTSYSFYLYGGYAF